MEKDESKDSRAAVTSPSVETSQKKDDTTPQQANSDTVEASTKDQPPCDQSAGTDATAQKAKSNTVEKDEPKQDALASQKKSSSEDPCDSAPVQPKEWVDRVVSDRTQHLVASDHDPICRSYSSHRSEVRLKKID